MCCCPVCAEYPHPLFRNMSAVCGNALLLHVLLISVCAAPLKSKPRENTQQPASQALVSTCKVSYGIYGPRKRHLHISVKHHAHSVPFEVGNKSTRLVFTHGGTEVIGYVIVRCFVWRWQSLLFGSHAQRCSPRTPSTEPTSG